MNFQTSSLPTNLFTFVQKPRQQQQNNSGNLQLRLLLITNQRHLLMSGSCHLDRASNVQISVECQLFVIVAEVYNLGHIQGIIRVP